MRATVAKWKELFADPRVPLPETVIPSAVVDDGPIEERSSAKQKD
jgi:hypothetical protein